MIATSHNASHARDTRAEAVLTVAGLCKSFGSTRAVDGVDFQLQRGSIHALLGGNGSGKSTTIKILAGVYRADDGRIELNGRQVEARSMTPSVAWEAGLRFVHQQDAVFPDLTVAENLSIGHEFQKGRVGQVNWRRTHERAREVLDRFGIEARPSTPMHKLRPSAQAMVTIARALQDQEGSHEGVLVLDEPTASLPAHEVDLLHDALARFAAAGQAILYVSHRLHDVLNVADRATILRNGKVVATLDRRALDHDSLVELIMGQRMARLEQRASQKRSGPVVLRVRHLSGRSIRDASFDLHRGEIVGIAGLLGSGRSSLLQMLFGAGDVRGGTIELEGRQVRFPHPRAAMAAGIAYVPEDRFTEAAFADLSIVENLGITTCDRYFRRGLMRSRSERRDARMLIERYGIKTGSEQAPLSNLSGGNQQKAMLGRWMRRDPKILLLDEPTQGIDVGARLEIWQLLREAVDAGAAAIVVSSDFEELPRACDRVLILHRGRITTELESGELSEENINSLASAGEEQQ